MRVEQRIAEQLLIGGKKKGGDMRKRKG